MLEKVLVANRGEIAIRVFRAAHELGIRTVAVYTPEDRSSLHRQKADEAYEVGEAGHPVRAYLDAGTLVGTAKRIGADAVYPGYGFLSDSPAFSEACREAGLVFVGPPPKVLSLTSAPSATPEISPTRRRTSTPWTTTSASPRGWWRRAPTSCA